LLFGFIVIAACAIDNPRGTKGQVTTRRDIPRLSEILGRRVISGGHESSAQVDHSMPEPLDWLHEVSSLLDKVSQDRRPAEFEQARKTLFAQAEPVLRRSKSEGLSINLDPDEAGAMEALIALDGSRPSLALCDGAVNSNDPWIGKWKTHIEAIAPTIREIASCVGRIEEHRPGGVARFGTGVLYDADAGLVLTAAHVVRNAKSMLGHTEADGAIAFDDGPIIDFCGEDSSEERRRLKILGGAAIGADGPYIDTAVLKVRPFTDEEAARCEDVVEDIPPAVKLRRNSVGDPTPVVGTFCVVGYPERAPPGSYPDATGSAIDWSAVVERLLGGVYGIKRLSPGMALSQPAPAAGSPRERRFGHDATTLFGSSGSPVFAWNDPKHPVFGVHVTGAALFSNFAEWIPGFSDRLSEVEKKIEATFGT
jgi:hypothetical protein